MECGRNETESPSGLGVAVVDGKAPVDWSSGAFPGCYGGEVAGRLNPIPLFQQL